jgi:hypothetical protein
MQKLTELMYDFYITNIWKNFVLNKNKLAH